MFKMARHHPSSAILENPINPVYDELFLLLNLFFLFNGMAHPFFLPRFVNLLGHRFAGEMSLPSVADNHKLFGGVEGLLDAEIFHFARNPRLSFIINQALPPGVEIAEPDFDPAINRIFSQFKKIHLCYCVYVKEASGTVPGAVATRSVAPGRYHSRYRTRVN